MLPAARFVLSLTLLFSAAACGEPTRPTQSLPTTPTLTVSPSPSPSLSRSPSPTAWQTYSNSDFGFTIQYPPNFLTEDFNKFAEKGHLFDVRFFDNKFKAGYPAGQVEIGVWDKDAGSPEEWLAKHSGSGAGEDPQIYYGMVSNQKSTTVSGRPAISWDQEDAGAIPVIHHLALFSASRVIEVRWFADNPSYAPTIKPIFDRMVNSYQD